jgi:hypothetical protein
MTIQPGKEKWTEEPWFVEMTKEYRGASEWQKERNAEGLEQCPLCGGPVTKEANYNFGCPACQLLFQLSPDGGRGISRMPNRDRNKPWPEESWVAKFFLG